MPLKCVYCDDELDSLDSALYHVDSKHPMELHRWATIKKAWSDGLWDLIEKEANQ